MSAICTLFRHSGDQGHSTAPPIYYALCSSPPGEQGTTEQKADLQQQHHRSKGRGTGDRLPQARHGNPQEARGQRISRQTQLPPVTINRECTCVANHRRPPHHPATASQRARQSADLPNDINAPEECSHIRAHRCCCSAAPPCEGSNHDTNDTDRPSSAHGKDTQRRQHRPGSCPQSGHRNCSGATTCPVGETGGTLC